MTVLRWMLWTPRRLAGAAVAVAFAVVAATGYGVASCSNTATPRPAVSASPTTTASAPPVAAADTGAGNAQRIVALWLAPRNASWLQTAVATAAPEFAETLADIAKTPPPAGKVTGLPRQIGSQGFGAVFTVPTTAGPFTVTTEATADGYLVSDVIPPATLPTQRQP
jgi:hypothetical protein